MNSLCARCSKSVYPMEKLNCLDKTWHKACFTCETCNLKLTMKTYKGYNKVPYCNTHYPTTKFTSVVQTPENMRLAKQTRHQSELMYRKDKAEAMKAFTPVADSVSNRQAQQSSRLASNIGYQTAPHEVEQYNTPQPQPPPSYNPSPPPPSYNPSPPQPSYNPPPPQPSYNPIPREEPEPVQPPPSSSEPRYVAIYDYTAADDDEVSFVEGDVLVEVTVIDDGWMEGRVKSTGQYGMLPSNYVEKQ